MKTQIEVQSHGAEQAPWDKGQRNDNNMVRFSRLIAIGLQRALEREQEQAIDLGSGSVPDTVTKVAG